MTPNKLWTDSHFDVALTSFCEPLLKASSCRGCFWLRRVDMVRRNKNKNRYVQVFGIFAPARARSNSPTASATEQILANTASHSHTFLDAINAHVRWKQRLTNYLHGESEEDLDYAVVSRDDCCHLGRWIHGSDSVPYRSSAVFERLRVQHAKFHRCAGEVLRLTQSGRSIEATDLLGGEYARLSREVVATLVRMDDELSR